MAIQGGKLTLIWEVSEAIIIANYLLPQFIMIIINLDMHVFYIVAKVLMGLLLLFFILILSLIQTRKKLGVKIVEHPNVAKL